MKRIGLLAVSLLCAATIAFAQDVPAAAAGSQDQSQTATTSSQTQTSQGATLRGCLSGSTDNYTLTDHNGTQYKLMGSAADLESAVGHEIEVSGTQSQSTESASGSGETMAHASNSFQISQVKDTGSTCKMGSRSNGSQLNPSDHPMDEKTPKGATTTSPEPQPQMIAMLQQSPTSSTDSSTGQQSSTSPSQNTGAMTPATPSSSSSPQSAPDSSTSPSQSTSPDSGQNTSGSAVQPTAPSGNNQMPSQSTSSSSASPQTGNSPANNTGMTPGEANSNAQAARQGELSTNPNTGQTTGAGVNGSAPANTDPNAVPSSTNSTSPQSSGTTPQTNTTQPQADDSSKPLYERQATDVPWAHHGSDNSQSNPNANTNSQQTPTNPH